MDIDGGGEEAKEEELGGSHDEPRRLYNEKRNDPPMLRAMVGGQDHVERLLSRLGAKPIQKEECKYAERFASGEYPLRWNP